MSLSRQIGLTQFRLLRDIVSAGGTMISDPKDNKRWCAAKRLTARGYLSRQKFGSERFGYTIAYVITDDGRAALRQASEGSHVDTSPQAPSPRRPDKQTEGQCNQC